METIAKLDSSYQHSHSLCSSTYTQPTKRTALSYFCSDCNFLEDMKTSASFLLSLCALELLSLTSQQDTVDFDFTVTRPTGINGNQLTFQCDRTDGMPFTDPMFYRDGSIDPVSVEPSTVDDAFLYNIDRMLEGSYTCGMGDEFGASVSPPRILVGKC